MAVSRRPPEAGQRSVHGHRARARQCHHVGQGAAQVMRTLHGLNCLGAEVSTGKVKEERSLCECGR